jgi:hypothetical protein
MKSICYIALIITIAPLQSAQGEILHRDTCKVLGDPCICANTRLEGYCLPGFQSKDDELYCDCESDVLSLDEVVTDMILRYLTRWNGHGTDVKSLVDEQVNQAGRIFTEIYKISKVNMDTKNINQKNIESAKIERQRFALAELIKTNTKFLPIFYKSSDGCYFLGQECECGTTGRQGVCAINRSYRPKEIYCHCG